MNAQHTPGPWRLEEGTNLVWGACNPDDTTSYGMGMPVAEAKVELNKIYDWEQSCVNARLIAAAPDLLTALVDAIGALEQDLDAGKDSGDADWEGLACQRLEAARAVIAKATGAA